MGFILTLLYIAISLLSPGVLPPALIALHVSEILGVLCIFALIPSFGEARIFSLAESYLMLGVIAGAMLSVVATGWISHAADIFLGFIPIVFTFYFVVISCQSIKRLRILVFVMLAVSLYIFAHGLMADRAHEYTSPYLEGEKVGEVIIVRFRGLGVLADPNDLAQLFVTTIPLLWIRWKKGAAFSNFCLTLLPAAALAAGIYYTHSRGALIAVLAVLLFGFKDKLGIIKSSILAGLAAAGALALNLSGGRGLSDDDGGRIAAWATGLRVFLSHPLFGIGINNFGDYNDTGLTAHNSFILCLAELGLFGYFFWMGNLVCGWTGLNQIIRSATASTEPVEANDADLLPHERYALEPAGARVEAGSSFQPWLQARHFAAPGSSAQLAAAVPSGVPLAAPQQGYLAPWQEEDAPLDTPAEIAHTARILRISLVGLLVAAFFISRTYSLTLYVVLGMVAALKAVEMRNVAEPSINLGAIAKLTFKVIAVSIVLLYVLVRLRSH